MTQETGTEVVVLGEGMLNWHRYERVGDRYGTVTLFREFPDERKPSMDDYADGAYPAPVGDFSVAAVGAHGVLRAVVIRNRESGHIGDLFRGFRPPLRPPRPGTVVELGEGELFTEERDGTHYVGLRPEDGRTMDWLSPRALYRVHEQTVRLEFVETGS